MNLIRKRLTYANVMSTLAVFLVLGGGAAFAASQLGKNTVGAKQLKKNAVTAAKVKKDAINGAKVADGSLTGADVADGSIANADIADQAINTTKLANNAVNATKLADKAVNSAKVQDKSLKGIDLADNSLGGQQIDESTLGQVPDAAKLGGKAAGGYLSSSIYKVENPEGAGSELGDGTFVQSKACEPGDVMLTGGPASVRSTSTLLESFPTPGSTNSWTARIQKNAQEDNWTVVVLCIDQ
ncbi:MAG: hypothetical protein ACJ76D_02380 [Solirubrobacterales bacterium]